MRQSPYRALLLSALLLAGCADRVSTSHAAAEWIRVTGDSVGPVAFRATRADLGRMARVVRDTIEDGDEGIPEETSILLVAGDTLRAVLDSGRVYRLSMRSPRFRTADSLGVGSPVARLLQLPGVSGITGEGAVFILSPRHCGISFRVGDPGELGDAPDSLGVEGLRRLSPTAVVGEVLVVGCQGATHAVPAT